MTLADSRMLADFGPITLTVALGMTAISVLLPRPQRGPVLLGAALGGLALATAAIWLLGVAQISVEAVLFYIFGGLALVSGGMMITQANPARAALAFAIVVLSTCGLFLLNAAPFVMAGTVIIYAGAIVVTFLFVLMLAQTSGISDADQRSREPLLATVAGFFLLSTLLLALRQTYGTQEFDAWLAKVESARQQSPANVWQTLGNEEQFRQSTDALMVRLLGADGAREILDIVQEKDDVGANLTDEAKERAMQLWLSRLSEAAQANRADADRHVGRLQPAAGTRLSPMAGTPANRPTQPLSADNVAGLGRTLFSDHLLAVELGGTLLLIATIGAIAITQRPSARRAA